MTRSIAAHFGAPFRHQSPVSSPNWPRPSGVIGVPLQAGPHRQRAGVLWPAAAASYELYYAVQQVEHRTTRIGSPESNGMVERFNRTLKEEFFSVAYRKRLSESVEALQRDLDAFLSFYNERRAHHGQSHAGPDAAPDLHRASEGDGARPRPRKRSRQPHRPRVSGDLPLGTH